MIKSVKEWNFLFFCLSFTLRSCQRHRKRSISSKCEVTWLTTWPPFCRNNVKCMLLCVSEDAEKHLRLQHEWQHFVSFLKGLSSTTSITVDFGDGTSISYVNISSIDDGIKHIYSKVGIYQVSATATNTLGFDRVILYLHISCKCKKKSQFEQRNDVIPSMNLKCLLWGNGPFFIEIISYCLPCLIIVLNLKRDLSLQGQHIISFAWMSFSKIKYDTAKQRVSSGNVKPLFGVPC